MADSEYYSVCGERTLLYQFGLEFDETKRVVLEQ